MRTPSLLIARAALSIAFVLGAASTAGCRRADSEPSPRPLQRESSPNTEVLERVRQRRAPGEEITRIAAAVEAHQVRYGTLPARVEDLVHAGLLPRMPVPPEGRMYVIDPLTGNVELLREADVLLRRRIPGPTDPPDRP